MHVAPRVDLKCGKDFDDRELSADAGSCDALNGASSMIHELMLSFALHVTPVTVGGNDLLHDCGSDSPERQMNCVGYLSGVIDTDELDRIAGAIGKSGHGGISRYDFCIPQGVTFGQVQDIITAYLRNNPSTRHFAAVSLVEYALSDAFPCPER